MIISDRSLTLESFLVDCRRCRRSYVCCWWSAASRTLPRDTSPGARGKPRSCIRPMPPNTTLLLSTTPCLVRLSSTSPTPSETLPSPGSRWTRRLARQLCEGLGIAPYVDCVWRSANKLVLAAARCARGTIKSHWVLMEEQVMACHDDSRAIKLTKL